MTYQTASQAAQRLRLTRNAMDKRLKRGVPGAIRRYRWEGEWLRLRWLVPTTYCGEH